MQYTTIPGTDMQASRICLGTMTFGSPVAGPDAARLVRYALEEHGVNFIDTANMYEGYNRYAGSAGGVAEEIVGEAVAHRRGGYILATKVGTQALVRIPDEVDFVNGAAATDAGMTSYAAVVRRGGVKAGDRVGIIGLGGLGQIGARVAHLLGAEVHVAEIKEDIWPLAKELGAVDARRSITDYPRGFFDVIVDFAGFGDTTADAVDVIRLGGVVVLVGMGRLETTIDAKSLIVNQCDLRGSNGGTPDDIRGVYELMRTGKLTPVTTTVSFDEVPEAIERLERGDVVGRLVISYE